MGKLAYRRFGGTGLRTEEKERIPLDMFCVFSFLLVYPRMYASCSIESQISQTEEKHENSPIW